MLENPVILFIAAYLTGAVMGMLIGIKLKGTK